MYYVKEGILLDKEVFNCFIFVYLVDWVLLMLFEWLFNDFCFLCFNVDWLVFLVLFVFNKSNKIINWWFGKMVIYLDQWFIYEEVQECIEGQGGSFVQEIQ